jgi:hypothetical protein
MLPLRGDLILFYRNCTFTYSISQAQVLNAVDWPITNLRQLQSEGRKMLPSAEHGLLRRRSSSDRKYQTQPIQPLSSRP